MLFYVEWLEQGLLRDLSKKRFEWSDGVGMAEEHFGQKKMGRKHYDKDILGMFKESVGEPLGLEQCGQWG